VIPYQKIIWYYWLLINNNIILCGSNAFHGYFDDAKESIVKKIPKIQESSFKNQVSRFKNNQDQDSRLKIQESREDSIKISTKKVFPKFE